MKIPCRHYAKNQLQGARSITHLSVTSRRAEKIVAYIDFVVLSRPLPMCNGRET